MPRLTHALVLVLSGLPGGGLPDDPAGTQLEMSKAVACLRINGYEDFEPLAEPRVTTEDKLLIYFRPSNYEIQANKAGGYRAHFKEDVKVRRRGEKKVLWSKEGILDYEATNPTPPLRIYLTTSIGVRGLPPGDYDLDIALRDALRPGSTATQTVRFTVVAAPRVEPEPDPGTKAAPPGAGESPSRGKPAKKARRPM